MPGAGFLLNRRSLIFLRRSSHGAVFGRRVGAKRLCGTGSQLRFIAWPGFEKLQRIQVRVDTLAREQILRMIRDAGKIPVERDALYNVVKVWS